MIIIYIYRKNRCHRGGNAKEGGAMPQEMKPGCARPTGGPRKPEASGEPTPGKEENTPKEERMIKVGRKALFLRKPSPGVRPRAGKRRGNPLFRSRTARFLCYEKVTSRTMKRSICARLLLPGKRPGCEVARHGFFYANRRSPFPETPRPRPKASRASRGSKR